MPGLQRMVYLAEPIDQMVPRGETSAQLLSLAREVLSLAGCTVFRPASAYIVGDLAARQIHSVNQHALSQSDALVVVLSPGVATLGLPAEIEQALARRMPVFILTTSFLQATSVQVQAWVDQGASVWLQPGDDVREQCVKQWAGFLWDRVIPDHDRLQYQFQLQHPDSVLPSRAYADDAGLDLTAVEDTTVYAGARAMLSTKVAGAPPVGTWGLILGRSSTWSKHGLMVIPVVVDGGWRGELFVSVYNPGPHVARIEAGQRVAQIVVLPIWQGQVQQVHALPAHERGLNGFGSSGA